MNQKVTQLSAQMAKTILPLSPAANLFRRCPNNSPTLEDNRKISPLERETPQINQTLNDIKPTRGLVLRTNKKEANPFFGSFGSFGMPFKKEKKNIVSDIANAAL